MSATAEKAPAFVHCDVCRMRSSCRESRHCLNELDTQIEGYDQYPELSLADVRPLWMGGCWDGPTSGFCAYLGQACFFAMCADAHTRRRFLLYRLTPEQWETEQARHALWCEMIGTHTKFINGTWKRNIGELVPGWRERWGEWEEKAKAFPKLDTSACEVLGWFER